MEPECQLVHGTIQSVADDPGRTFAARVASLQQQAKHAEIDPKIFPPTVWQKQDLISDLESSVDAQSNDRRSLTAQ